MAACATMGSNTGHRLGGDISKFPDNTLEALRDSFQKGEHLKKSWKYIEFDLNETKDNVIVVFHDRKVKKRAIGKLKKFKIINVNHSHFKDKLIKKCCKVPTFQEVMAEIDKLNYTGKVMIEFKHLHSNKARQEVLDTVDLYRKKGKMKISYLAFPTAFRRTFPVPGPWCEKLVNVHQARKHKNNLCKK